MANNTRYQIFVSSTYKDLFPARRKVTEHILSMNHIPAGMEMFSASGRQQWNTIKKAIDNSDYYVLIVGERYGSISEEDGVSFTEKEFDYARSKSIPTLCFLPGGSFPSTRDNRESEPLKIEMLERFKTKVLSEQLCSFWETEDELVQKISTALYKIFTEEPGVGWIRGDASDPEALAKLVKVMEENNILRDKVRFLEEERLVKKPALSFRVNEHDGMSGVLNIELPELGSDLLPPDVIKPLRTADISLDLRRYVDEDDILKYNKSLPSEKDVKEYEELMQFYLYAKDQPPEFSVYNSSITKANNVSFRIMLPEGILALSSREIDEFQAPSLELPENPILAARKKQESFFSRRDLGFFPLIGKGMDYNIISTSISRDLYIENPTYITGGVKFIRQNTAEELLANIHLLPMRKGTFILKISILCDEFTDWETTEFVISIS